MALRELTLLAREFTGIETTVQRERAKTLIYALAIKVLFWSLYIRLHLTWRHFTWFDLVVPSTEQGFWRQIYLYTFVYIWSMRAKEMAGNGGNLIS